MKLPYNLLIKRNESIHLKFFTFLKHIHLQKIPSFADTSQYTFYSFIIRKCIEYCQTAPCEISAIIIINDRLSRCSLPLKHQLWILADYWRYPQKYVDPQAFS